MSEIEGSMESTENVVIAKEKKLDVSKLNLREEVIILNRCAKVVKGGRRFSFSALVVVGDGEGHVGLGFGKANEVPESIAKGIESAKKNVRTIPLMGGTIPHQIYGEFDTARVLMKPASEGTGLIASAQVRKVLELAGVKDILAKSLGSDNVMNVAKATLAGLLALRRPDHIAKLRGKSVESLIGAKRAKVYEDSMEKLFGPNEEKKAADIKKAEAEAQANAPVPDLAESEPPVASGPVTVAKPVASQPAPEAPAQPEATPEENNDNA